MNSNHLQNKSHFITHKNVREDTLEYHNHETALSRHQKKERRGRNSDKSNNDKTIK